MSARCRGSFIFVPVTTVWRWILALTRVCRVGVPRHTNCSRHRKFMITAQRRHPILRVAGCRRMPWRKAFCRPLWNSTCVEVTNAWDSGGSGTRVGLYVRRGCGFQFERTASWVDLYVSRGYLSSLICLGRTGGESLRAWGDAVAGARGSVTGGYPCVRRVCRSCWADCQA